MADKNTATEVLIDGKVYHLSGADPAYLQQVSGYINSKILELKKSKTWRGLDSDYRQLFLNLNIADDYFRERNEAEELKKKNEDLEKELYSMKHEIVSTKLKLENSLKQQNVLESRVEEWKEKFYAQSGSQGDYS